MSRWFWVVAALLGAQVLAPREQPLVVGCAKKRAKLPSGSDSPCCLVRERGRASKSPNPSFA